MEPIIYKPGAYNTPGVYKGSCGIYKGRGVYNDGGAGPLQNCIFLTYFENFNEVTGQDVPIIGPSYNFDQTKQKYTRSTLNLFGGSVSALKNEYKTQNIDTFYIPLDNDVNIISAEIWLLCEGNRPDFGSIVGLGNKSIFIDPNFNSTLFDRFNPSFYSTYTLKNGSLYIQPNYIRPGINPRFVTSFISLVFDRDESKIYFYINGVIMFILNDEVWENNIMIRFYQDNDGKTFTATGLAIFDNDKSENNRDSYPVPTQKYTL